MLDRVAIISATAQADPLLGNPQVRVRFHPDVAASVREFTRANVFKRLAIVLDGDVISVASLRMPIDEGELLIENIASMSEASRLAKELDKAAIK